MLNSRDVILFYLVVSTKSFKKYSIKKILNQHHLRGTNMTLTVG